MKYKSHDTSELPLPSLHGGVNNSNNKIQVSENDIDMVNKTYYLLFSVLSN